MGKSLKFSSNVLYLNISINILYEGKGGVHIVQIWDVVKKSVSTRTQFVTLALFEVSFFEICCYCLLVECTRSVKMDHGQRMEFDNWVLEKQHENSDFAYKIIFRNEAHFHNGGFVNKQKCRYWCEEKTRVIQKIFFFILNL